MEYGTGAIMAVPAHDERDFEFARKFGLPDPRGRRPGGEDVRGRAVHRRRPAGQLAATSTGCDNREALRARSSTGSRREGKGQRVGQLPPARLAALAPALLGLPDPDRLLRRVRHRAGARGPAAGRAARRRGLRAEGQARRWRPPRTGSTRPARVRRPGAARDRHDGHLRRLVLVLPALLRRRTTTRPPWDREVVRLLDAGRPVHRRRRARDPAPDVRALLHQGARGHGAARRRRSRSRASSRRG